MILHLGGSKLSENGWRVARFGTGGLTLLGYQDGDTRVDGLLLPWLIIPGECKSSYGENDAKSALCGESSTRVDPSPVLPPMLSVRESKGGAAAWER